MTYTQFAHALTCRAAQGDHDNALKPFYLREDPPQANSLPPFAHSNCRCDSMRFRFLMYGDRAPAVSSSPFHGKRRCGLARDFVGGPLAKGFVLEGLSPKRRAPRVLGRPLTDDRDDCLIPRGTGGNVCGNEACGGCGIGFRAQAGKPGEHVVARGTGLLRFGPLVSAFEIPHGPLGYEAGGQTGIDLLEMVVNGHYHRGEWVPFRDGKATALEQDAGINALVR
jgi:hypothetical protein